VVRFARLTQRRVRDLGGPAVRAAFGGNLSLTLLPHSVVCRSLVIASCQSYTSYVDYELCEGLTR
jgi:hypothetical protein